ncbi:MAG: hypothetical protein WC110_09775 [Bacteroidales bacterium]|jgi:gliding motility-associated lipoprotein GldH|nr:hypothetical protein [Bacteroidales bacterium]
MVSISKNRNICFFLLFFLLPALNACSLPDSYQKQSYLPAGGWEKARPVELTLTPRDSAIWRLLLDVRLTRDYNYQYLSLKIQTAFLSDTFWLPLAGSSVISSGLYNDYRFVLRDSLVMHPGDPVQWRLFHNMPRSLLEGVTSAGLLIEKTSD